MPATDLLEQLVLDHLLLQKPFSIEDWYVGIWTSDPTTAGLLTGEVSVGEYQRKPISWANDWTNSNLIQWAAATVDWGTLTHVVLLNSPTKSTGNIAAYGAIGPFASEIGRGNEIPVGGLVLALT